MVRHPSSDKVRIEMTDSSSRKGYHYTFADHLMALAFFLLPIGSRNGDVIGVDISKAYPIVVILLVGYWLFGSRGKKSHVPWQLKAYFCYYLVHHLSVAYYTGSFGIDYGWFLSPDVDAESGYRVFLRSVILLSIIFPISALLVSRESLRRMVYSFSVGLLLSILISFSAPTTGYTIAGGDESRLAGGYDDPNALGTVGAVGTFLVLGLYPTWRDSLSRLFWGLLLLGNVSACAISGSRGAMLGLFGGGLYYFYYLPAQKKIYLSALIVSGTAMLLLVIPSPLAETLGKRYSVDRVVVDRGSSRLDVWTDYYRNYELKYWLGVGFRQAGSITEGDRYPLRPPHNHYFTLLVEQGIIGLFLFLVSLLVIYKRYSSENVFTYQSVSMGSLVICWLLIMVSLDIGGMRILWGSLGILCSRIRSDGS